MLLAEPPRTRFDLHFRLAGFAVRVHPMFWVIGLILGIQGGAGPAETGTWVACMFVSILIHELGHALLIRRYGWSSRIILYHFGGLATFDGPETYLPTYNANESSPKAMILISAAGPGAGFLLAALVAGMVFLGGGQVTLHASFPIFWDVTGIENFRLLILIRDLLFINIFWGIMNLLPVYPLDGGQIARELLSLRNPRDGIERSLLLSTATGVVIAVACLMGLDGGLFVAVLFGLLAFQSYKMLQALRAHGGHGGSGGKGRQGGYDEADDDWWRK